MPPNRHDRHTTSRADILKPLRKSARHGGGEARRGEGHEAAEDDGGGLAIRHTERTP